MMAAVFAVLSAHSVLAGVAVVALVLLVWMAAGGRKPRERHRAPDALDEGAEPAQRNRALIDAPSAAAAIASPAAPAPAPAPGGDDLTRIKGVGPRLVARLGELGITRFAAIAGWSAEDQARIDAQLGSFAGRPARDNWVEQASYLARDDIAGFEAKFGKL